MKAPSDDVRRCACAVMRFSIAAEDYRLAQVLGV